MINAISTAAAKAAEASAQSSQTNDATVGLADRVQKTKTSDIGNWYTQIVFHDYLKGLILSDGIDTDNQPEW
ncbi:hypothetical protein [[Erwinia] mediterraneensis]|uniref:hypothetical protein n=1 Tax=[Erwinia] mediterraneensis TaxID=2161819 RepID=UPI001030EB8A|nr:hypothetical protein [[Erwinia] mediterraneensis]